MAEDRRKQLAQSGYSFSKAWFGAPENKAAPAPPENKAQDVSEEWTLKSTPEEYLERHPDGPNAELARRILEG